MLATLVGHETFAVNYAVAFLLDPAIFSCMEGMTLFRETVRAYLPAAPGADGRGALMPGLRSKKPEGTSDRLCHCVGNTGQSSGRGTW